MLNLIPKADIKDTDEEKDVNQKKIVEINFLKALIGLKSAKIQNILHLSTGNKKKDEDAGDNEVKKQRKSFSNAKKQDFETNINE